MNKHKIIQVVENYGGCELLKYRFENFGEVDYFLVVGSIDKDLLEKYESKVSFLSVGNQDEKYNLITNKLFEICEGSDDIVVFGASEEFCDFSKLKEIRDELNYGPFFLKHTEFWWGKNYVSKQKNLGSFVCSFLHLILDKKLLSRKANDKKNVSNFYRYSPINGWSFHGFYDTKPEDLIFKQFLNARGNVFERLVEFSETNNLPPNFHEMPNFIIEKNQNFGRSIKISFVTDTIDSLSVSDDFKDYNFVVSLPKSVLYGEKNFDEFLKEFKEKEIERIKHSVGASEYDVVEIKNPS